MSYDFSAAAGQYLLGTIDSANWLDGDWTIAFWIKATAAGSSSKIVTVEDGTGLSGGQSSYTELHFDDWRMRQNLEIADTEARSESGGGFIGVWKCVAIVYDDLAKQATIYAGDADNAMTEQLLRDDVIGEGVFPAHDVFNRWRLGAPQPDDTLPALVEHVCLVRRIMNSDDFAAMLAGNNLTDAEVEVMAPLRAADDAVVGTVDTVSGAVLSADSPTYAEVDTTPPAITLAEIQPAGEVTSIVDSVDYIASINTLVVRGTTDDAAMVEVRVGSDEWIPAVLDGTEWYCDVRVDKHFSTGLNTVQARAADVIGNTSDSVSEDVHYSPSGLWGFNAVGEHLAAIDLQS